VAGNRVDRLDFAAIARRSPGVEQHDVPLDLLQSIRVYNFLRVEARVDRGGAASHQVRIQRPRNGIPRRQATIEHGDVAVSDQPQHPPEARSCIRPAGRVIGDDVCLRRPAPAAKHFTERLGIRQWMASEIGLPQVAKIAIQVGIDRAGNMRERIFALATLRIAKVETAVDDEHVVAAEHMSQGRCIDQRGTHTHATASRRLTRFKSNSGSRSPDVFAVVGEFENLARPAAKAQVQRAQVTRRQEEIQRDLEHVGHFVRIRLRVIAGIEPGDDGRDPETTDRFQTVQIAERPQQSRANADFLASLAQRRGNGVGIPGFDAAAGKAYLAAVRRQVFGPAREQNRKSPRPGHYRHEDGRGGPPWSLQDVAELLMVPTARSGRVVKRAHGAQQSLLKQLVHSTCCRARCGNTSLIRRRRCSSV
jgi:hypothetical protein